MKKDKADIDLKQKVRLILVRRVGRESAIAAEKLVRIVYPEGNYIDKRGIDRNDTDDRPIRKAIEELIVKDGLPVCSVTEEPAGYFIPRSPEEARKYCKNLQRRAVMIFIRKRRIIKNAIEWYALREKGEKQLALI